MRIWIDLTNSPHVNFFAKMIEELQEEHDVVLTCRPLANTIELLELLELPHHVVGRHYGRSRTRKVLGFAIRTWQLRRFLRSADIDAAISHSSFYSPIVARSLRVPCLYLNDNEHAEGNRISFLFATTILVPQTMAIEKVVRQGGSRRKTIQYPGVKEGVYLWALAKRIRPDKVATRADGRKTVFVRPEPWTAQYYRGRVDFLDELLVQLAAEFDVVLLPRGEDQAAHYRAARFDGIAIPDGSLDLATIVAQCDLFLGAGGTMTREAAVMGIPTISIYQDELLDVDRYLIGEGHMIHEPNPTIELIRATLADSIRRPPAKILLEKGHEAYELIKRTLLDAGRRGG